MIKASNKHPPYKSKPMTLSFLKQTPKASTRKIHGSEQVEQPTDANLHAPCADVELLYHGACYLW